MKHASSNHIRQIAERIANGLITTNEAALALVAEAENVARLEQTQEDVRNAVRIMRTGSIALMPHLDVLLRFTDDKPRLQTDCCAKLTQ